MAGIVGSTEIWGLPFRVSVAHRVTPMTCCTEQRLILQLVVEDLPTRKRSTATAR